MEVAHGLEGDDAQGMRRVKQLAGEPFVGGEGLLDQYVLACLNAAQGLCSVKAVGRGNIDGIDGVARDELS